MSLSDPVCPPPIVDPVPTPLTPRFIPTPTSLTCAFFVCDMQSTFRETIVGMNHILPTVAMLSRVARVLECPIFATEHDGYAATCEEIDLNGITIHKKYKFSMCINSVVTELRSHSAGAIRHICLYGIEAHICVLQTALDLLREGYTVYLIVDAISSQHELDYKVAIKRLAHAGCILSTAEGMVFELLNHSKHPRYDNVVPLVKEWRNQRTIT